MIQILLALGLINTSLVGIQNLRYQSNSLDNVYYETINGVVDSIENTTEIESIANDEVDVLIFLDNPVTKMNEPVVRPMFDDLYQNKQFLINYRNYVSNLIYENNASFISYLETILPNERFHASNTSPFVSFKLNENNLNSDFISHINSLSNNSKVDSIYFREQVDDANVVDSYIPFTTAADYINVLDMINSKEYTGDDINIGFIESTLLNTTAYSGYSSIDGDYTNKSIKLKSSSRSSSNYNHIAQTTMIAAGNNGIASDANILSAASGDDFQDNLTWMVDNDVNVLNTSFGYLGSALGNYSSYSKIADQMIHDYLYTHVSSAGNLNSQNNPDNELGSPASGFNVIAVGNTSSSKLYISSSSSYRKDNGYYGSKPNLVAPGAVITNSYGKEGADGTSFSAPEVSGCIALLMEEFPYLVAYPELVISIVTSSTSPMSSIYNNESGDNHYDGSGLHNQIGAGLLNYEKMREAASQYLSITRPNNSSTGIIPQYIDIVATDEQRIRASSAWLYDEDTFTNYDLELYKLDVNGTMDRVAYIDDPYNNVEFIDFDVKTTGTYRLVINQKEQNAANDFIGLSYVLIDDVGGSTSGATNIDDTLDSHFEIDRSIYEDYGDTYNSEPITEFEINDGIHTFETTRKRARFTDDGKLVLSAKSNDSNYAYMEYKFDITDPINDDWGLYNIKYQFGLWSDDESLIRNSSIDLYGLHHDSWLLIRHFDPKEMSTDPNNLKTYIDCLDFPVNGLRFYVKTNYTNNDNNVGRVVIGNIEGDIHYHLYTKYEQYNDYYHKVACDCGDYHLESHTWGPSYSSGIYEYANCTKCNEQHNMTSGGPIVTPIF